MDPTRTDIPLLDDPLLSPALHRLAGLQLGFLTVTQLVQHGVPTTCIDSRLRYKRWRRAGRGVVDVRSCPLDSLSPGVRASRSAVFALLRFGPQAVAVGLSALVLHGVLGIPVGHVPEVARVDGAHRRGRDGVAVRRWRPVLHTPPGHWPMEDIRAALAHSICAVGPRTGLGLLDSALHQGLIADADIPAIRTRVIGRRGAAALGPTWALADGRRESPLESWAYFDAWQAGFEPTDVQVEIRDRNGLLLARSDLGYEFLDGSWLLYELQGKVWHEGWEEVQQDGRRAARVVSGRADVVLIHRFARDLGSAGVFVQSLPSDLRGRVPRPPRAGLARRNPEVLDRVAARVISQGGSGVACRGADQDARRGAEQDGSRDIDQRGARVASQVVNEVDTPAGERGVPRVRRGIPAKRPRP